MWLTNPTGVSRNWTWSAPWKTSQAIRCINKAWLQAPRFSDVGHHMNGLSSDYKHVSPKVRKVQVQGSLFSPTVPIGRWNFIVWWPCELLCNALGSFERAGLKAAVPLPGVAAFLSRMATNVDVRKGGKVNASGNFVRDLEMESIQNRSKWQRARACLSRSLTSCLCYFSTRDLTLRIFTLLPSSAISICSTLLDLYPSQSKILLKLPVLAATWKQNSAVAAAAMVVFN